MEVAIKVVSLKGCSGDEREKAQKSFAGEVSILVHMRHPHVISIWGVINDDLNFLQLVMEYVASGDLASWLKSDRQMGEYEQVDLCQQMASGEPYTITPNRNPSLLNSLGTWVSRQVMTMICSSSAICSLSAIVSCACGSKCGN